MKKKGVFDFLDAMEGADDPRVPRVPNEDAVVDTGLLRPFVLDEYGFPDTEHLRLRATELQRAILKTMGFTMGGGSFIAILAGFSNGPPIAIVGIVLSIFVSTLVPLAFIFHIQHFQMFIMHQLAHQPVVLGELREELAGLREQVHRETRNAPSAPSPIPVARLKPEGSTCNWCLSPMKSEALLCSCCGLPSPESAADIRRMNLELASRLSGLVSTEGI